MAQQDGINFVKSSISTCVGMTNLQRYLG